MPDGQQQGSKRGHVPKSGLLRNTSAKTGLEAGSCTPEEPSPELKKKWGPKVLIALADMKGLQSRPSLTPLFAGFLSSTSSRPDSFCLIESACSYPASVNPNHKNEQLPVSLGVLFLKTRETASKPPCWSFLLLLSLLLLLCVLSLEWTSCH